MPSYNILKQVWLTHSFWPAGRGRARCRAILHCCRTADRSQSCPRWPSTSQGSRAWSYGGCRLSTVPWWVQKCRSRLVDLEKSHLDSGQHFAALLPDAFGGVDDGLHDVVSDKLPVLVGNVLDGRLCAWTVTIAPVLSYHVLQINDTWVEAETDFYDQNTPFKHSCKRAFSKEMCEGQCSSVLIYFFLIIEKTIEHSNTQAIHSCVNIADTDQITAKCVPCWILITPNTQVIPGCILTSMRNLPSKLENKDGPHSGRGWKSELDRLLTQMSTPLARRS